MYGNKSLKSLVVFSILLVCFTAPRIFTPVKDARAQDELQIEEAILNDSTPLQPIADTQAAQDTYLDLVKQKARLMTPEKLDLEINRLREEIFELQASLKLRETQAQLRKIIEKFPNSAAAATAKAMIDASLPRKLESGVPIYMAPTPDQTNNASDPNGLNRGRKLAPVPVPSNALLPTY